jgi:uncharacterized protein
MTDATKTISKFLRKNTFVDFAYLFGSQARGTADERSDWDIAVHYTKPPENLPRWTTFYLEAEISREIGKEVQIVALNTMDSPVFLFQIIKDGVLLVDKHTEKRILFESHVLLRYCDWQAFIRRHPVKSS